MVRSINGKRYVLAAFITAMIFILGLMLGLVIEGKRVQFVEQQSQTQKLDLSSLQLQYAYLIQLGEEKNCNALTQAFDASVENLETTRIRLENYDQKSTLNKEEFQNLKREYTQAQLQYWLFAKRVRGMCGVELATIVYFFGTEEQCPNCEQQAFVLTYLKKRFGRSLLNFALDGNYDNVEPVIATLKSIYGIEKYPALIIENKTFYAFTSKDEILNEICKYYSEPIADCLKTNQT